MYVYCCDTNGKQRFKCQKKKIFLQAKNDLLIIDH